MATTHAHWVELRIHGVSGTPPEDMLGSGYTKQVAGDAWGRFFRPVDSTGREVQEPGRVLEGYHWGQFTSGNWRQGLWLILIPFGFVNAAAFMVPDPGRRRAVRFWTAVTSGLIRCVGVGLTSTFTLAFSLILVDLLAWRTAPQVGWLKAVPNGYVMAAGVVASALVMLGVRSLGNQKRRRTAPEDAPGSIAATNTVGLCRRLFYSGDPDAPTLGRLHLAAAWTVSALIGIVTTRAISPSSLADALLVPGLLLVTVITLATTFLGDPEASATGTETHKIWHQRIMHQVSYLLLLLAVLLVLGAAWAMVAGPRIPDPPNSTRAALNFDSYSRWLLALMALVVAALFVACAALAAVTRDLDSRSPRQFHRYARGLAPAAAASTGLFLGVGFCGSFVLGAAKAVGAGQQTELLYRVAYAWGWTVLLGTALVVVGLVATMLRRGALLAETTASYAGLADREPPRRPLTLPEGWERRVAGAAAVARAKNLIPAVFLTVAGGGLAMTVVAATEMFGREPPFPVGLLSGVRGSHQFENFLIDLGTYALLALAGGLYLLGRRALSRRDARRGVNVIWDVVSFWPHSAHPFVPPAYSQFAVRELRNRVRFHLGELDARPPEGPAEAVVISAHSQGSLIAFASMLWLGDGEIERVGLVTFGSQLQVAFARAFPAYVNFALIEQVYAKLAGRWINLYRETDPIAGPVLSWDRSPMTAGDPTSRTVGRTDLVPDRLDPDTGRRESGHDWRLLDPAPADPGLQLGQVVKMARHSGFPASGDYPAAVARVRPGSGEPG